MGWASGVKGQAMATATRPAGPPPPKAPTAIEQRATYADPVRRIDRALNWYRAGKADGRAEMLAEAVAYLRQCGRDEWAAGLEAALAEKEGD